MAVTHDTNVVFRIDRWVRSVGACRERANAGPHTGELRPRSYGCRVCRDRPHGFWRGVTPLWLLWFVVFRTGTFSAAIRRRRLNHCVLRRWNSKHRRRVRARLGIPDGYPVRRLLLRQDSPCWCVLESVTRGQRIQLTWRTGLPRTGNFHWFALVFHSSGPR